MACALCSGQLFGPCPGCGGGSHVSAGGHVEAEEHAQTVSARSTQLWRVAEIEADGTLRVQGFTSGGVAVVERTFARVPLGTEPPLRTCPRSYDRALADSLQAAEKILEECAQKHGRSSFDVLIEVRKGLAENRVRLGATVGVGGSDS